MSNSRIAFFDCISRCLYDDVAEKFRSLRALQVSSALTSADLYGMTESSRFPGFLASARKEHETARTAGFSSQSCGHLATACRQLATRGAWCTSSPAPCACPCDALDALEIRPARARSLPDDLSTLDISVCIELMVPLRAFAPSGMQLRMISLLHNLS